MILVDTSALSEYYRPTGRPDVQAAVSEVIADDEMAVNGIIQVELLAFAASEKDHRKLVADFHAFHWLELNRPDFDLAEEIGFRLRRVGITVPATDLIIASSAIRANAELLHVDAHFDSISQHSPLKVKSFIL